MRVLYFVVCFSVLLAACSSGPKPILNEYLLSEKYGSAIPDPKSDIESVRICAVDVADYLTGGNMVMAEEDGRIIRAERHLWAESLSDQLGRVTRAQLASMLPDIEWYVDFAPEKNDAASLMIRVDAFNVTASGHAEIRGYWRLFSSGRGLLAGDEFNKSIPLPDSGYSAMVKVLNDGWSGIVDKIAKKTAAAATKG